MPNDRTLLSVTPLDDLSESQSSAPLYGRIVLEGDRRTKLEAFVKNHLEQIETALGETHGRFAQERAQFEGLMEGGDYPYPGFFRINVPITKKKVREIANRLKQAYLDSDPIWAVVSQTLPQEIVAQVEKGLDHQVDNELFIADDLSQAIFEAVMHGVGAVEPTWAYHEDIVQDVIAYQPFDGVTAQSLMDLIRFEQDFPNWREDEQSRKIHSQLVNGREVRALARYRTATINRPDVCHIPAKDLRVYPWLNSHEDVQFSPCYGYVKNYTRSELEALAADETIDDDQLGRVFPDKSQDEISAEDATEPYEVARLTVRYRLDEDDEPARYKVWYEKQSGAILRCRAFPWFLDAADLVLFHVRQEEPGIFKRGIAWDLQDTHTAANTTFSLFLNGADMANSMRWYTKRNSLAEAHILQRRWSPHLPLPWEHDPNEAQSLVSSTSHLGPLVQAHEFIRRISDEDTQTTSLQSGKESPTDPDAPATKTIALLQQMEPNTKEYLRSLEPGFRTLGQWIVHLYIQGKRMGWIDEISGFPELSDEQLTEVAKQLQPRALLFEFDRGRRAQTNLIALQMIAQYFPQAAPQAARIALSQLDSQWAKLVDTLPLEAPPAPSMTPAAGASSAASLSRAGRLQGLVPTNGAAGNPRVALAGLVG